PEPGLLAVTVAVKVTDSADRDGLAEELAGVVVPYFTVCVSLEEVLPLKFASPPYDALIEWEPTASVLVTNVAWPEPFRVPVPRVLEPSLKVTVPVGVPAPGLLAVTVAVKVTDCPDSDGLAEELTSVVVLAFVTVGVSVLEVLPVEVAPPPEEAVVGCGPTASVLVTDVAWPAAVVVVGAAVVVVAAAVVVVVVGAVVVVVGAAVVVVVGAAVVVVGAAVVVVVLELVVVVLLVLVLVELVDVLVDVLVLLLVVVVGVTHVPLESQVPPAPHGAPVLGVMVQLDVPLQL